MILDINNRSSITEALEFYVKGEMLEGDNAYLCQKCDKKVFAGFIHQELIDLVELVVGRHAYASLHQKVAEYLDSHAKTIRIQLRYNEKVRVFVCILHSLHLMNSEIVSGERSMIFANSQSS